MKIPDDLKNQLKNAQAATGGSTSTTNQKLPKIIKETGGTVSQKTLLSIPPNP
jgi:hypothetical protein